MFHNNNGNDAPRSSPPFQQPMQNPYPPEQQRAFQGNRQRPNMFMNRGGFPPSPNQNQNRNQNNNMFSLNQMQMRPPMQRGPRQQQQPPQNQNMFAPNQMQMPHPMNQAPMQQQAPQNMPFAQQPYMEQPKEKGGILSKLFRKSGKNNAAPQANMRGGSPFAMPTSSARSAVAATSAASAASSGGILQSILNPGNLTSMLNNTQRVLQAAESFTPLVQQYGPLVKNIPAMWNLFKGLNAEDDTTDDKQPETKTPEQTNIHVNSHHQATTIQAEEPSEIKKITVHNHSSLKPHIQPKKQSPAPTSRTRQYREGESKPKLFM